MYENLTDDQLANYRDHLIALSRHMKPLRDEPWHSLATDPVLNEYFSVCEALQARKSEAA